MFFVRKPTLNRITVARCIPAPIPVLGFALLLGLGAPGTGFVPGSWVFLGLPCSWVWVPQVTFLYLGLGFSWVCLALGFGCPRYRFCTWVLGLPCFMIPTGAARFSLLRRFLARRAAEWRDHGAISTAPPTYETSSCFT